MTSRKLLDYGIAALAGGVAILVKGIVDTEYFLVIVLAPALSAIFTFIILHKTVGEIIKDSTVIRRWVIPVAQMEGMWVTDSKRRGEKKVGIVELYYDTGSEVHCVSGISYGASGALEAEWYSQPILFDRQKVKLEYRFEGERQIESECETQAETEAETKGETDSEKKAETKPETKRESEPDTKAETKPETEAETKAGTKAEAPSQAGEDDGAPEKKFENIEGWTTMSFDRQKRDIGHGYFINFNPKPVRREFTFKRLTGDARTELLGRFQNHKDSEIMRRLGSPEYAALCSPPRGVFRRIAESVRCATARRRAG